MANEPLRARDKARRAANREKLRARDRAYRAANREKVAVTAAALKYGISKDRVVSMWQAPCEVCGVVGSGIRGKNAIDHCHKTGQVRGTLCMRHNMGLGLLEHFVADLSALRSYWKKYNAS